MTELQFDLIWRALVVMALSLVAIALVYVIQWMQKK